MWVKTCLLIYISRQIDSRTKRVESKGSISNKLCQLLVITTTWDLRNLALCAIRIPDKIFNTRPLEVRSGRKLL